MNNELFQQARTCYATKDYEQALGLFTRCLQDPAAPLAPGETGLLYHQIGNCLVKLKNPSEAIQAYSQATGDGSYDACGAVNYNLGMAYASLHDYDNAVRHFEVALSDAKYDTPYKAYTGMGNALMKLGKSAEAGVAFREAALDERNPDPTKALLNLGVCFMALDRPGDAVASYESALQFDMQPDIKNKLYANLGQAYVASGQMQKAVNAFEEAIADQSYFLSDSASVDYQRAIAAVAQGTASITQVQAPVSASAGLDEMADEGAYDKDPYAYSDDYGAYGGYGQSPYPPVGPQDDDDRFFTASDEDIEQWSRGLAKQSRRRRSVGLKILLVILILVLVALGVCVFGYTQGYGYPTQETVVRELFNDPDAAVGTVIDSSLGEEAAQGVADSIVADPNVTIDGVNKSMSTSTVYATATTEQGGEVTYEVTLGRDLIGWKVVNAEIYHPSQS